MHSRAEFIQNRIAAVAASQHPHTGLQGLQLVRAQLLTAGQQEINVLLNGIVLAGLQRAGNRYRGHAGFHAGPGRQFSAFRPAVIRFSNRSRNWASSVSTSAGSGRESAAFATSRPSVVVWAILTGA